MLTSQPTRPSNNDSALAIRDYIKIIFLRKWWPILFGIVGTSIAIIYSYSLPNLYRSSTLIMVERQRIPETYVQSTITSSIQDRLSTISQRILSRTNLEAIISQFSLDKKDDFIPLSKKITDAIKEFLNIDIEKYTAKTGIYKDKAPASWEDIIEGLRKSIEVNVVGGNSAFTLSYTGRDPQTVMNITNMLATLFTEENLKFREQHVETTSEFLADELVEAKRDLEKQEKSLKEFKGQHMGALPEQMDMNLRTLDRLQSELQTIIGDLRNVEDRKLYYEQQLKEHEKQILEKQLLEKQLSEKQREDTSQPQTVDTSSDSQMLVLERLKEELTRLRAQFNENYPDVVFIKNQIREIETRLSGESDRLKALEQASSNQPKKPSGANARLQPPAQSLSMQPDRLRLTLPSPQLIKSQLQSTYSEIEFLRERQKRTTTMIKDYERRVEETFANEQKLVSITRDYEMSQNNYQGLLQKRLNARVAENLERRQKGERFRILDPANLPQKPYEPNRPKLIALGSLLSAGLGVGFILIKEHFRPLYRKAEDFHDGIDFPALVVIPHNRVSRRSNFTLVAMKEPNSMITEQYRVLYTKISRLEDSKRERLNGSKPWSVFAVSSALKNEGKTITTLNLALITARDFDKKTIVVEGDLKNPRICAYLGLKDALGLTDIVLNNMDVQSGIITWGHDNLSLLAAGSGIGPSSSILSSAQLNGIIKQLKEEYDFIFIDSPPILGLPDMNIIERLVDGIILVTRSEKTPRDTVMTAALSLQTNKLIGFVLNDVRQPMSMTKYYDYHSRKL